MRYTIQALDVWGHHPGECGRFDTSTDDGAQQCWDECGGYDVNNWFDAGMLDIREGTDDAALLRMFIDAGLLKPHVTLEDVCFDDCSADSYFQVEDAKTGEPLYQCYGDTEGGSDEAL